MSRLLPALLFCIAAGVAALTWLNGFSQPAPEDQASPESDVASIGQHAIHQTDAALATSSLAQSDPASSAATLPPELAQQTSWTNPYRLRLWTSNGWQFSSGAMIAAADASHPLSPSSAQFLRDWKTFAVSLHVAWPPESPEVTADAPLLTLSATSHESSASLRVSIMTDAARLDMMTNGDVTPLGETSITDISHKDGVGVRLMLAPNRLLVRWNDQLLFNVARPAAITGGQCRFVVTAPPGTRISELRLDGE